MASTRRNTASRALIAIALVTLAAMALPARAVDAPRLLGTSADAGWGANASLAARFDRALDESSIATMADRTGRDVPGGTTLATSTGSRRDSIIFMPAPNVGEPLAEDLSPYTITFTAQSALAGQGSVTVAKSFKFDLGRPTVSLSTPASGGLHLPGDTIKVVGGATDPLNSVQDPVTSDEIGATFRSGLTSRVEVQFFNLLSSPGTSGTVEVRNLRQYPALAACTSTDAPGCEQGGDAAWSVDTSKLTTGKWTLKVYASDVAGNRSLAGTVEFTKIG